MNRPLITRDLWSQPWHQLVPNIQDLLNDSMIPSWIFAPASSLGSHKVRYSSKSHRMPCTSSFPMPTGTSRNRSEASSFFRYEVSICIFSLLHWIIHLWWLSLRSFKDTGFKSPEIISNVISIKFVPFVDNFIVLYHVSF